MQVDDEGEDGLFWQDKTYSKKIHDRANTDSDEDEPDIVEKKAQAMASQVFLKFIYFIY
jgi:hypothetical protein